jgi:small conductance mechanosensitive channel
MTSGVSTAWAKIQGMLNGAIAMLPNIVVALIVFLIFYAIAREIKWLVRRITTKHRHARNLGLVLGRLSQGIIILVGLFIALSIVIPSFKAGI